MILENVYKVEPNKITCLKCNESFNRERDIFYNLCQCTNMRLIKMSNYIELSLNKEQRYFRIKYK